jgi:drug/metabolite transporter (DMT)-like permease
VPSLSIAAWRLGFAALVATPFALMALRRQAQPYSRQQLALGLAAGLCLAAHFAAWISSLEYTSIASSTALVTTNPLWIGLASFVLYREKPRRAMLAGIALSLVGSLFIFLSDSQQSAAGSDSLLGNALALFGAWCFSAYLMIGRRLRAGLTLTLYVWLTYGSAALLLFATAAGSGLQLSGFAMAGWLALAGMALGPQLIGHTSYNWSLKHVSATFVAVVTLGEPIGGALMAWIFLGETLAPLQTVGFGLLLTGIYLAAKGERRPPPAGQD